MEVIADSCFDTRVANLCGIQKNVTASTGCVHELIACNSVVECKVELQVVVEHQHLNTSFEGTQLFRFWIEIKVA